MIKVENIGFKYSENIVFEDISFNLKSGHIYGLVGENGSGKTTLLLCLNGYYYPNTGKITYHNQDIDIDMEYLKNVFLLNDDYYIGSMSVEKLLKKLELYYNKQANYDLFELLLENVNLNKKDMLKKLSKGNKKIAILCAVLAMKPQTLLLDEFLDGIDIVNRRFFKDYLIRYVYENEAIIVVSSHVVDDIKDLCDELILIKDKKVALHANIDDFKAKYVTYQIVSDVELNEDILHSLAIQYKEFKKLENIYWISVEKSYDLFKALEDYNFKDIRIISSSIEEVLFYEYSN